MVQYFDLNRRPGRHAEVYQLFTRGLCQVAPRAAAANVEQNAGRAVAPPTWFGSVKRRIV